MNEQTLKQLVASGKASIIYVHGTARSGSTIAQVIFSSFADRAIHEPFVVVRHPQGGDLRPNNLALNTELYEKACGVIVNQILEVLKEKDHATILVKDISFFFELPIWERWIQIPEKFLFTIREPHSQYFSDLSLFTYYYFQDDRALDRNREFVLQNALTMESLNLQNIWPGLDETVISNNKKEWEALIPHVKTVRSSLDGTFKKIAIMDLNIMRMNPYYAIEKILKKLDLGVDNIESCIYNLNIQSYSKIFDLGDPNREGVRKARNSKTINPLVEGEDISPYAFPPQSQKHIWRVIPIYLDLLYAPEQVAMPSLEQLDDLVAQSETLKLEDTHPFEAYAIANFHLHQKTAQPEKIVPLIERILKGNTKISSNWEKEKINSERFKVSFEIVDRYWNQRNQGKNC
ncbi:MAG TPA: hypothetical protein DDW76_32380 [Cyanobacteria bacterium UBA11369]|nr:hypothetical protein [Cyanobacteria bacterium UBA11371]HBE21383.1 hypothetical protein [Cyanobacteria bacterium UBA11367]HBE35396.1 hypothetical protein [Cyanobacteria bacterium UBA11368]HBE53330.1 hypothetical protein [Cyanobacteria bacterium UBA11369]